MGKTEKNMYFSYTMHIIMKRDYVVPQNNISKQEKQQGIFLSNHKMLFLVLGRIIKSVFSYLSLLHI